MKKLLLIAVILLAVGIVIAGIGAAFAFGKPDFSMSVSPLETFTTTYNEAAGFTDIEIDGDSSKVTLIPWEGEGCKVVCTEAERITHTVEASNGTLRIIRHDNRLWYEHFGVFIEEMTIDVYLPETEYEKLKIDNSSGSVDISEGFVFSEIDVDNASGAVKCNASAEVINIDVSSGSIKLQNVSASDIKLDSASGSINAENISVRNEFYADSSSGSIKLSDAECGDISVTASSGSVKLSSIDCGNISAECSSGSINLSDVIASDRMKIRSASGSVKLNDCDAQDIDIRTASGSVSGTLLTGKIFETDTGSGSVKVPSSEAGGRCVIETGSGSIKISISGNE